MKKLCSIAWVLVLLAVFAMPAVADEPVSV